jgi:hypothetical protein
MIESDERGITQSDLKYNFSIVAIPQTNKSASESTRLRMIWKQIHLDMK